MTESTMTFQVGMLLNDGFKGAISTCYCYSTMRVLGRLLCLILALVNAFLNSWTTKRFLRCTALGHRGNKFPASSFCFSEFPLKMISCISFFLDEFLKLAALENLVPVMVDRNFNWN